MSFKTARHSAVALALLALATASTIQAQTATQTVTFAVNAINQIAFAGAPSLTIITAVAGAAPTSVTNALSTWAVTTNQTGAKITASIPTVMPVGLTLSVTLAAPATAASLGTQPLGIVAVDLVTTLTKLNQAALLVTYKLDATPLAGVVVGGSRIVTYTITGGT